MNVFKKLLISLVAIAFTLVNISPWTFGEEITPTSADETPSLVVALVEMMYETPTPIESLPPEVSIPEKVIEEVIEEGVEPISTIPSPAPTAQPSPSPTPIPQSNCDEEIWVLAQAMCGESFENNYEDMIKVGMALFNRVDSPDPYFPDDLISVIRQPSQVHGYSPYNKPSQVFLQAAEYVVNTYYSIKAGVDLPWEYDILYWGAGTGANYGSNIFRTDY